MTSRLTEIVIDCADPARLADFWCAVLGYQVLEANDEAVEIGPRRVPDAELLAAVRREPVVPSLTFIAVPEPKSVKNRLHLDVSPIDSDHATEVARLEALGARQVDVGQGAGRTWVVLADPEGNELCLVRSLAPGEFEV